MLQYADLMAALDIPTVRALEDFLITECFYNSIVAGKLDQRAACLQVCCMAMHTVRHGVLAAFQQDSHICRHVLLRDCRSSHVITEMAATNWLAGPSCRQAAWCTASSAAGTCYISTHQMHMKAQAP